VAESVYSAVRTDSLYKADCLSCQAKVVSDGKPVQFMQHQNDAALTSIPSFCVVEQNRARQSEM
jgi:hypothetical protein